MPIIPKSKQDVAGLVISEATVKSPLSGNDCLGIMDSEALTLKKITLAAFKAWVGSGSSGSIPFISNAGSPMNIQLSNGGVPFINSGGGATTIPLA